MDGKIVYQVRVDSSRIPSDLAAASSQISSGTSTLISLGQRAATSIGSALNAFFGAQNGAMTQMLSSLSSGFARLAGSTSGASSALSPLTTGIKNLLGLDLNKLLSFFDKLTTASTNAGKVSSVASQLSALTAQRTGTTSTLPKYRSGSDYIEKDKYAFLHKGEAVLTAAENETLSAMGGVEGAALMAAQKSTPLVLSQEQSQPVVQQPQPQNVHVTVELDGYRMAQVVATATNELNRQLNTRVIK